VYGANELQMSVVATMFEFHRLNFKKALTIDCNNNDNNITNNTTTTNNNERAKNWPAQNNNKQVQQRQLRVDKNKKYDSRNSRNIYYDDNSHDNQTFDGGP